MLKYQLQTVRLGHTTIKLSEANNSWTNTFTILVGRNATGKSRLLSKIISSYMFSNQSEQRSLLGDDVVTTPHSLAFPQKIIAVSTGRFDRFPRMPIFRTNLYSSKPKYHYLGVNGMGTSPQRILSQSITSIFSGLMNDQEKPSKLAKVFEYLGFAPMFNVEFRRLPIEPSHRGDDYFHYRKKFEELKFSEYIDESVRSYARLQNFEFDILPRLKYFLNRNANARSFSLRLNLMDVTTPYESDDLKDFVVNVIPLLRLGMISASNINVYSLIDKSTLRIGHASSGQQCMLLIFLGIAGSISDGSLICIDEPEISLHPEWQSEFISILQSVFTDYSGCHFMIATHSPQIVSGLTSENGFVVDLESGQLHTSSEYSKKSADFQLAEIFHAPGFKNEYLIRIILVLISKITKFEELTIEDRNKINYLRHIQKTINESDPVHYLINQLNMLAK